MTKIKFIKVGPLVSIQDNGRFGALGHGAAASGPMDRSAYKLAAQMLMQDNHKVANTALESAGGLLKFSIEKANINAAFCGGQFNLKINGVSRQWNAVHALSAGDIIEVAPGASGNYALIRMDHEFVVPEVINSYATNTVAHLGGYENRLIKAGDAISLTAASDETHSSAKISNNDENAPIRFVWGMHAEKFSSHVRNEFLKNTFVISSMLNRMGVRLMDKGNVFKDKLDLSLVSDAIVPGDVQILGDGTPIVLMRDHQPTGGYPRIATVISADLDRFSQLRPGAKVEFCAVTVDHAHKLIKQAK
ncbi:Allophanate hydrolase 2 subunit 2 [hydrothermal vent metagenome]|uniref:Allophanate hydrolase 2 subunit 2 n=1 Tax=hydrothermal vent metagenome TaxID=652676 RepID=A0A3B0UI29_9ZZZZ